jgi:hypothetical protein
MTNSEIQWLTTQCMASGVDCRALDDNISTRLLRLCGGHSVILIVQGKELGGFRDHQIGRQRLKTLFVTAEKTCRKHRSGAVYFFQVSIPRQRARNQVFGCGNQISRVGSKLSMGSLLTHPTRDHHGRTGL